MHGESAAEEAAADGKGAAGEAAAKGKDAAEKQQRVVKMM